MNGASMRAIFLTIALSACLTAGAAEYVEVVTNNVNIRTEPSTSSAVAGEQLRSANAAMPLLPRADEP